MSTRPTEQPHPIAAMSRGAAATWIASGAAIVAQLVTLRWAAAGMGREELGAMLALASVSAYLSLSDLGIGLALMNASAAAGATRDGARLERLLATGLGLTAVAGVAMGGLGLLASAGPLDRWFSLGPAAAAETRRALAVLALLFAARIPLSGVAAVHSGLQALHRVRGCMAIGSAAQVAFAFVALRSGAGLTGFAAALGAGPVVGLALAALDLRRRRPELRLRLGAASRAEAAALVRPGLDFFLLQLAGVVVLGTDNLVIALRLGAEAVPGYAIPFQLALLPGQALAMLAAAAWPVMADRSARGDAAAVVVLFRSLFRGAAALGVGAAVVVVALGRELAHLWMGTPPPFEPAVLALGAAYAALNALENASAVVLNATGRTRGQVRCVVAAAALNLALSWTLAPVLGSAGVAVATLIAALATTTWYLPFAAARATGERPAALLASAFGRWVPWVVALGAAAAGLSRATAGRPFAAAGAAVLLGAAWVAVLWATALRADERSRLRELLAPRGR